MIQTMEAEDGVGLAANQIGKTNRVIIATDNDNNVIPLINPEIIKNSFSKIKFEEACLSCPGKNGKVTRFKKVKIKALNQDGNPVEFWADKLFAIVLQHEIDHINGILFIDKIEK